MVPSGRVRVVNSEEVRGSGSCVLYWMTSARRVGWNYGLDRALEWCEELGKPLVVLEALRCGYRYASERLHAFVVVGMADNARALDRAGVHYYPYVEPEAGAGSGLLRRLAEEACVVVGDDYPCGFLPRATAAGAAQVGVRYEAVDSNGILPMRLAEKEYVRAYDFRRFAQRELRDHVEERPRAEPFEGVELPRAVTPAEEVVRRWAPADGRALRYAQGLDALPIDHEVSPVEGVEGGRRAGLEVLERFVGRRLQGYGEDRNHPDRDATSRLSPYLHFGHVSAHEVFARVVEREEWSPGDLAEKAKGSREGWWGLSGSAEGFLDQLITWRELGFNGCVHRDDYAEYSALPDWAQATLAEHSSDPRPQSYTRAQFDAAKTHDALWNAAQRQLRREGYIHNYLRMLWGKKILHWSRSPQEALAVLLELNDRYALDGRDPNSYSGILWCLGRYDRPWGPERKIFGKVRYMTSDNTRKKVRVRAYLERYA